MRSDKEAVASGPGGEARTRRNGDDTRRRILEAAERLFAEQGLGATSLRAIARAAGVRQPTLHYHFRDKRELFRASLDLRVVPLFNARLAALEELEKDGRGADLESIIAASQGPIIRAWRDPISPGVSVVNLLYRASMDAEPEWAEVFQELALPVRERYVEAFQRALPELPHAELMERLNFTQGALAGLYVDRSENEMNSSWRSLHLDPDAFQARIVALCSAVLRSPSLGPPPRARTGSDSIGSTEESNS